MIEKGNAPQQTFKVHQYNLPINFDLNKVALVVVDMQNDFIHPEGIPAKQGFCVFDLDAFVK